jgi:hypothetical protein
VFLPSVKSAATFIGKTRITANKQTDIKRLMTFPFKEPAIYSV